MNGTYHEFALLLMLSALVGALAVRLRQPLLVAYIIVGIAAGPGAFGWVKAEDQLYLLAQIGVIVLLFLVGLKLDLRQIRHIGPVALATGLGQLGFTILFGFLLVMALGKGWLEALYVAVALTFSSTIIIVKLLSDKRELDSLHGRIAVGFLIVQDLAVVIAMTVISGLSGIEGESVDATNLAFTLLLRFGSAALLLYGLMRYVLPRVVDSLARSQELLLIFAIAWGTALAAVGEYAGFSKEAGAFIAGFSLASTAYRDAIGARLASVRDFLLLFFFIDLGARLDFSTIGGDIGPALVLSVFVLVGNPIIVMAIMGYMGYRKRTSFLAGLTVAQISEFSIIFVAMGNSVGHVGPGALGLTTLVGLITITLSSYMILYSHRLYAWLAPGLGVFERNNPFREIAERSAHAESPRPDVLLFGLGRYGSRLALKLREQNMRVMGVDFDPEVIKTQQRTGLDARFGDCEASDFIESLPLKNVPWVVSSLPDVSSNRALLGILAQQHYSGQVAIVARDEIEAQTLHAFGQIEVILPFNQAADFAALDLSARIASAELTNAREAA